MKKIFFNSSMPRSGSELMQVLLSQNPEVYGSATSPVFGFFDGVRNHMSISEVQSQPKELMNNAMASFCVGGLHGYYSRMTDRPVVVDKSRAWMHEYELLESVLGEKPKMICMVRDLREIVASNEVLFRNNPTAPAPELRKRPRVEGRVEYWLNDDSSHVAFALRRLADAVARKHIDNIHVVKFEELVLNPQGEMDKVWEYLEMESFDHDTKNLVKLAEEDCKAHGIFGDHTVRRELKPVPRKANEILGKDLASSIRKANDWYYETFYS